MSPLILPLPRRQVVLEERLQLINPNQGSGSNCIGTAFYLAGFTDQDRGMEPSEGKKMLRKYCYHVKDPGHDRFMVVSRPFNSLAHLGYLFEQDSEIILAHRLRWDDYFEMMPLEDYLPSLGFGRKAKYFSLPETRK